MKMLTKDGTDLEDLPLIVVRDVVVLYTDNLLICE